MNYEEIKTPQELYDFMEQNIKYGFMSKIDNKHYRRDELNNDAFYDYMIKNGYYLQTPNELLKSRYGICFDQVELIRDWLTKHNYKVHTFFSKYHNHVFIIYEDNNKYYYFERTFPKHNGIYESDTIEGILEIYKDMQVEEMKEKIDEIEIYPFYEVNFHCGFREFIDYASSDSSLKIILKISEEMVEERKNIIRR